MVESSVRITNFGIVSWFTTRKPNPTLILTMFSKLAIFFAAFMAIFVAALPSPGQPGITNSCNDGQVYCCMPFSFFLVGVSTPNRLLKVTLYNLLRARLPKKNSTLWTSLVLPPALSVLRVSQSASLLPKSKLGRLIFFFIGTSESRLTFFLVAALKKLAAQATTSVCFPDDFFDIY